MQTIFFSNRYNLTTVKFREMIDKLDAVREKTDDYEIINQAKDILGVDYYNDAVVWLRLFRDSIWWRDDLI